MLIEDAPPNLPPPSSDRVELMRDRFERIKNGYGAMVYFCQLVTGINNISIKDLERFEIARFHTNENFKKNHSFPVSQYLERIDELEKKVIKLGGEI